MLGERKECCPVANLFLKKIGANLVSIEAGNLQNVQKMWF